MVSEFARSSLHVIWLFQRLRDGKDIGEGGESSVPQSCRHRYLVAVWCHLSLTIARGMQDRCTIMMLLVIRLAEQCSEKGEKMIP